MSDHIWRKLFFLLFMGLVGWSGHASIEEGDWAHAYVCLVIGVMIAAEWVVNEVREGRD